MQESAHKWRQAPRRLPDDTPNILIVMLDDAGFGQPDTFGGEIHTPTLTRLAEEGISYNRFHTTAMCSPTRAGLLTGRYQQRARIEAVDGLAETLVSGERTPDAWLLDPFDERPDAPPEIRAALRERSSPFELGLAAALGLFLATLPLIGFHMIAVVFAATLLRLNRLMAFSVSHLCTTPFVPATRNRSSPWDGAPEGRR